MDQSMTPDSRWQDWPLLVSAAAVGAVLLWSGTPIANKMAVDAIDPATAGLLRSALAGVVAGVLALLFKLPFPTDATQRWLLAFSGLASFAVWPLLLSIGLGLTTANHAALMIATIPVVTGLMAAALERSWAGRSWTVGVSIAAVGTAVLVGVRTDGPSGAVGSVVGDLVILSGVVACSAGYVAGGKLSRAIGPWATSFWGLGLTAVVLVPVIGLLSPRTDWSRVSSEAWFAIGYMTLFSSLIGYVAWFWALGRGGITRMSAWQLGQPVFTVVLAVWLLGEQLTTPLLVAGAAVLAGTALTQFNRPV
jgi:drug/metabolite transporter (DMT)-like permease